MFGSKDGSVNIVTLLRVERIRDRLPEEEEISLFSISSSTALRFTVPPIQCVPFFSPGLKQSGHEEHHLHLVSRLRMLGAVSVFSHTSSCRGVYLSTGAEWSLNP
jgi:hypothetical protein